MWGFVVKEPTGQLCVPFRETPVPTAELTSQDRCNTANLALGHEPKRPPNRVGKQEVVTHAEDFAIPFSCLADAQSITMACRHRFLDQDMAPLRQCVDAELGVRPRRGTDAYNIGKLENLVWARRMMQNPESPRDGLRARRRTVCDSRYQNSGILLEGRDM